MTVHYVLSSWKSGIRSFFIQFSQCGQNSRLYRNSVSCVEFSCAVCTTALTAAGRLLNVCMYRFNSGNSVHKKKKKKSTNRQKDRQTKANYIYKLQANQKTHKNLLVISLNYLAKPPYLKRCYYTLVNVFRF